MNQAEKQSLDYTDHFVDRHIGPSAAEIREMLAALGYDSLDALMDAAIPESIRLRKRLSVPEAVSEYEVLAEARQIASRNRIFRSYLGMGYNDTITPPSSSAISWRTRGGTPPTPPTRPRSRRAASRRSSTSRRWSST